MGRYQSKYKRTSAFLLICEIEAGGRSGRDRFDVCMWRAASERREARVFNKQAAHSSSQALSNQNQTERVVRNLALPGETEGTSKIDLFSPVC